MKTLPGAEISEGETRRELGEMSIFEHLGELRKRIVLSALAIVIGAFASFYFIDQILALLNRPYFEVFPPDSLIGTGPAEAFIIKLKAAFFAGVVITSPYLFLQLWLFISPGLYERERRMVVPFVIATTLLFLLGVSFCYGVVLPFAFDFFLAQYRSINVTASIRLTEHLSFMMQGLLVFGAMFELPMVAFFLGRVGLITHRTLQNGFRYAVVVIFVLSAVLTPPDVLTQFLLAIPLIALYGLSIGVVWFTERPRVESSTSKDASP